MSSVERQPAPGQITGQSSSAATWFADLRRARAALREGRITPAAMAAWVVITQGFERQSHAQIARDLGGKSVRQVIRWIAELEEAQLLDVGRRGAKRINRYWIRPASRPRVVGGSDAKTCDTGVTSPVTPESPFLPLSSTQRVESKRPTVDVGKEEALLLAAWNTKAELHGWEHAFSINPAKLATAIADVGGVSALIGLIEGVPPKGLRRGRPVEFGILLDPRWRSELRARADRHRKSTEAENPWVLRIARFANSAGWDQSWGPRPDAPDFKAQFDRDAVAARLDNWFRRFEDLPKPTERYEQHIARLVGPEHARQLMDLVRERRAARAA